MSRINEKKMPNVKTQVLHPFFYMIFCVLHRFHHDDLSAAGIRPGLSPSGCFEKMGNRCFTRFLEIIGIDF